jgi:ribonuclease HI
MRIEIFTDGSSRPHTTKTGGWSYYCVITIKNGNFEQQIEIWKSGGAKNTTNNRMELLAIIKALEFLSNSNLLGYPISIYSDSKYCVDGANVWINKWISNNWNDGGIKNKDLWERIYKLKKLVNPTIKWVRGHDNHYYNEMADKLAVAASDRMNRRR